MRRLWSVTVSRDERLEEFWQRVREVLQPFADKATITPIGEIMWMVGTNSEDVADAAVEALVAIGAKPLRSARTIYDEGDFETAAFVGIFGKDLSLQPPFVLNEEEAYRAARPCPLCGHHDAFDTTTATPPRIDEAMLDAPAPDGSQPGPHGWEAVHLPNAGLVFSKRLIATLQEAGVKGLVVEDVQNAKGAPSDRMAAVRAEVAVLTPCHKHTVVEGGSFCSACGAAQGQLDGYFWIPRSAVSETDIVSRHPGRAAMLAVSLRVFAILAEVPGIVRGDPIRVCDD